MELSFHVELPGDAVHEIAIELNDHAFFEAVRFSKSLDYISAPLVRLLFIALSFELREPCIDKKNSCATCLHVRAQPSPFTKNNVAAPGSTFVVSQ
jgi:hypothetical protein